MQIREIHIDGFGIFSEKHVTGLGPGINVIYGSNEAGKTTFMEFIRRILFGFPTRRERTNPYTPLGGGSAGGRLLCETRRGERLTIARFQKPRDAVIVSTDAGEHRGQAALESFLDYASKEIFHNIYAFSLDELQDFDSLKEEEIQNRIYGAGLGLGRVSLAQVEKQLRDRCEALFKPRGSNQEMSRRFQDIKRLDQEIRAIQKEMGQFDTSIQELQKMESDQKALQDRLDELNIDWESLNTQKDLYEHVIALLEGQAELEGLETVPGFPENGRETLTRLKQKTDDLKERIEEEKHRLERLEADRDALEINTDLLDREPDVIWLQQSTQAVHAALQDQVAVQQEKDLLEEQVQVDVQEIGPGWNEDRARNFELGETRRGRIQEFQNTLESFRQYENRTRDQLEYHRLKKAEEQSRGWNIPEWLRYFQYLLYGLGLGGVGAGGFLGNIPLVLGAVAVLGLGVVLYRFIKKDPHTFEKEDAVEKRLAQQHERAKQDLDMKFGEWRTWLEDLGLDPTLTPGEVDRIGTAVDQVRFRLGQIRQLDRRLDQMKATIQEAVQGVERIAPSLPDTAALHSDVKANIEIIARYFEDARTHRERKTHLENQCREQAARLEGLNQHYQESLEELHRFIRESGARDEDNFITLHQTLERRKTLQNQGDEKRAFIQSRVGLGDAYHRFLNRIQSTHPPEIRHNLDRVNRERDELSKRRDHLLRAIGELRSRIDHLSTNDDLLTRQTQLELCKQQLNDHARQWVVYKTSLSLLQTAKREYEKTRQPAVIQAAEHFFTQITQNRYRRIIRPLESDEIRVEDARGRSKTLAEMSRGTREQLYLSMRLGLIEEYESRSEPLPVIMDDVLVNFDDARKSRVIELLSGFASRRQVIVLTCHRESLQAYLKQKATPVTI